MSEKQDKRTAGTVNPPEDWLLQFDNYLENKGVSPRTAASYRAAVRLYYSLYKELTPENLTAFKNYLVSRYKSSTVNLRLHGINQFIRAVEGAEEGLSGYQIPSIKQQQKTFLEHVISQKDYERIKRGLKKDQCMMWYFVVRFLCATGTRISELLQIKAEHVRIGYMDLCSKGGGDPAHLFPGAALPGGPGMAGKGGTDKRIFIHQPPGRASDSEGRQPAPKGRGAEIPCPGGNRISPLLPPPVRQKLSGPL